VEVYASRYFIRWAKKERLSIEQLGSLSKAFLESACVSLGSGLFKARVPKAGNGKRGGYRFLFVASDVACFLVFAFGKNEMANVNPDALKVLKLLAKDLLALNPDEIDRAVRLGKLRKLSSW